jgi:hypothetical protein
MKSVPALNSSALRTFQAECFGDSKLDSETRLRLRGAG